MINSKKNAGKIKFYLEYRIFNYNKKLMLEIRSIYGAEVLLRKLFIKKIKLLNRF
jgi:hypothetical protein